MHGIFGALEFDSKAQIGQISVSVLCCKGNLDVFVAMLVKVADSNDKTA